MSGLPKVTVNITNGALGTQPPNERGVSALTVTATAVSGLQLATPKLVNSLPEVEALGITAAATAFAHRQVKGFYDGYNFITGSQVAPLWLMTVADTVTLTNMADKDVTGGAVKLLNAAGGKVRRLGLARKPGVGYTPTLDDGIDADSLDALPKAQILGNTFAAAATPIRVLIEGRAFAYANVGDLADLLTHSENRAGIVLASSLSDGSADVGFALGVAAGLAATAGLQRKIWRVKNGALTPITQAYIGDTTVENTTGIDAIHDKGYIIYRTYPNKSGYYFNDDHMAAPNSDDYHSLSNGSVIDEAQRIAHRVYSDEIGDEFIAETGGTLSEGTIATLESKMRTAIEGELAGMISAISITIDPAQNVVSSGKVKITARITPVGYFKEIEVDLGFTL